MLRNVTVLKAFCVVLPAASMAAAHWFPWRRLLRRDLHQLEAYAIGTTAIVGTASAAIGVSDGKSHDHASMVLLAALGAGTATLLAYIADHIGHLRGKIADLRGQKETLSGVDLR